MVKLDVYKRQVQVVAPIAGVQATGTGAPPMPWPQPAGVVPVVTAQAEVFPAMNGFAASPGRTEM